MDRPELDGKFFLTNFTDSLAEPSTILRGRLAFPADRDDLLNRSQVVHRTYCSHS